MRPRRRSSPLRRPSPSRAAFAFAAAAFAFAAAATFAFAAAATFAFAAASAACLAFAAASAAAAFATAAAMTSGVGRVVDPCAALVPDSGSTTRRALAGAENATAAVPTGPPAGAAIASAARTCATGGTAGSSCVTVRVAAAAATTETASTARMTARTVEMARRVRVETSMPRGSPAPAGASTARSSRRAWEGGHGTGAVECGRVWSGPVLEHDPRCEVRCPWVRCAGPDRGGTRCARATSAAGAGGELKRAAEGGLELRRPRSLAGDHVR